MVRVHYKIFFTLSFLGAWIGSRLLYLSQHGSIETSALLIPLRCPMHFFLGVSCPTCGLGRSIIAFFNGEWSTSFQYHPFGSVLVGLSFLWLLGVWFFPGLTHNRSNKLILFIKRRKMLAFMLIVSYTVWGFIRGLSL